MELIYSETNKMHFDNENLLGAKSTTEWGKMLPEENKADKPTLLAEKIFGKTNSMDRMFCTGLLDIFGIEKTNELLSAAPVTHEFYLNDEGECKGKFAEEIVAYILKHSDEDEARRVNLIHSTCKVIFLGEICKIFDSVIVDKA